MPSLAGLSFEALGYPYPQSDPTSFIEVSTLSPSFFSFQGPKRQSGKPETGWSFRIPFRSPTDPIT